MLLGPEAKPGLQRTDGILERFIVKGDKRPASLADEVMMVVVALLGGSALVARHTIPHIHACDYAEVLKDLDAAIDAGDADRSTRDAIPVPRGQPLIDLLHGEGASLPREQLDQHIPCPAAPVPGATQPRPGTIGPRLLLRIELARGRED